MKALKHQRLRAFAFSRARLSAYGRSQIKARGWPYKEGNPLPKAGG